MYSRSKLVLSCLAATLLMAAAVSSASASRLSISGISFRVAWDRTIAGATDLTFAATVGEAVTCPVTLEGTLHSSTITKTAGLLIGYVTRASIATNGSTTGRCTGGNGTILAATLPWHVQYSSFGGTLPNITSLTLRLINASFQIANGSECLARTTAAEPGVGIAEVANPTTTREILFLRLDETRRITLREGAFGCALANGVFRGNGAVTLLGSTARPLLRLI